MRNFILAIISLSLFIACSHKGADSGNSIKVNINERHNISIRDLFSAIDIIPLETNDELILREPSKVIVQNNYYYVFDYSLAQIFIFDMDGNYTGKINHRGNGPKEYISLTDFEINENNEVMILSADDGTMCCFDNGVMTKKIKLPAVKRSYKSFKPLNEDTLVCWTFDDDNRVKFVSLRENKIINEVFPEKHNNFNFFAYYDFPYGNHISRSADNNVYEYTPDCRVVKSYSWDFGRENNTPALMSAGEGLYKSPEDGIAFMKKTYASENINYIFSFHGGNSVYRYTQITRHDKDVNIFYNILTNNVSVFEKTTEGAKIFPVYWTDNYIIGIIPEITTPDEIIPDAILSEENRLKKNRITETDNPVLIKYTFR